MEEHNPKYNKGFNDGYLIAKHEPGLFQTLVKGMTKANEYVDGLLAGGRESRFAEISCRLPRNSANCKCNY
jgi:hypothetical protein